MRWDLIRHWSELNPVRSLSCVLRKVFATHLIDLHDRQIATEARLDVLEEKQAQTHRLGRL